MGSSEVPSSFPPLATMRARQAGVRPNSVAKDCMIFRFCWAMETCGTCWTYPEGVLKMEPCWVMKSSSLLRIFCKEGLSVIE